MSLRDHLNRLRSSAKSRTSLIHDVPTSTGKLGVSDTNDTPPSGDRLDNWPNLRSLEKTMDRDELLWQIFKELIECNKIFETQFGRFEAYEVLQVELETLFGELKECYDKAIHSHIVRIHTTRAVEGLCRLVRRELSYIQQGGNDKLKTYAETGDDKNQVLAFYRRAQSYLQRIALNVGATASVWDPLNYSTFDCFNSIQEFELKPGVCTRDTRVDVISRILAWTDASSSNSVYWVNGMAGTGKTTIASSLCAELHANHKLAANVFCSRLRRSCRDAMSIIQSIAYQLARFSHPFHLSLLRMLQKDPGLCYSIQGHDFISFMVDYLFNCFIALPLLEVKHTLPDNLVVIIDGLDECDNKEHTRLIVELFLTRSSGLPLKFIVLSRPEPEIRGPMKQQKYWETSQVVLHELGKPGVKKDIKKYLRASLDTMEPTEGEIQALAEQAGVLFVYSAAIVEYISYGGFRGNPRSRLATILDSNNSKNKDFRGIDALYDSVLRRTLDNSGLDEADDIRRVLYIVGCAQGPLTVDTISRLLKVDDTGRVWTALRPLWSLLHISEAGGYVTILHPSFPAYILDLSRSKQYCCDPNVYGQIMAHHCFRIFRDTQPQFNICALKSSYIPDTKIVELPERTNMFISADLFYAAQHWAIHLQYSIRSPELLHELEEFLSRRLLLWMEIMNLKGCAYAIPEAVRLIKEWDTSRA
ncbi:unnamed protein product, partial [Rhizoctonia solani]